jgi:outer membrane biosynthesis protein TonB
LVLHVAAILLALELAHFGLKEAPPTEQIVPVDLVRLADKTTAAAEASVARVPQEKAKEIAGPEPAQAVPTPEMPPPPATQDKTAEKSPPVEFTAPKPTPKPALPKSVAASRSDAVSAARLQSRPSPAADLAARLQRLAQLRQPSASVPPSPREQDGAGESNVTASNAHAARGWEATYGVKDFIRAQVERRWNLDRDAVEVAGWTVSIHIVLDPNGRVRKAEIVDDPRYSGNPGYHDFALSARNAVLLSSPLLVPPGAYDIAKDIVVDFDSRQVSQ